MNERDQVVLELLGPSTGGIRRHVGALVAGLAARGWTAETAGPAGVLDGITTLDRHVRVPGPGPAILGAARSLRRAVDRSEASVVHAHGLKAGWLAALSRVDVPVVVTVHNLVLDEAAGAGAGVLRWLEARLPSRVAATIAASEGIAQRFADSPGADRVVVIRPVGPTPIPSRHRSEVAAELGVGADESLVVSLARLHPQKDLPTLLRATAALAQRVEKVRVVVAGEGPESGALHALRSELGLEEIVTFMPPTDDPASLLAAADAVVVSSAWESGPLVVAEALELRRPVVSTPVGFVPELIVDGASGRIVPVGDAEAMAVALADVLLHPRVADEFGLAGHDRVVAHLERDRLLDEVAAVYERVVAA